MLTTGQDIEIRHPLYGDITAHIRGLGPDVVRFGTPGGQEDQVTVESFTAWMHAVAVHVASSEERQ